MKKKIIGILIMTLLIASGFASATVVKENKKNDINKCNYDETLCPPRDDCNHLHLMEGFPESHLIEGVPYVSQETNFYCGYATPTMIFKYYGLNTTLQEVVYYSGVGYSMLYQTLSNKSLPYSGWRISQDLLTCKFLADLYGLSYEPWETNPSLPKEERWNEDWSKIKQNITNDIPMAVLVDEIILAADNLGFGVFYPLLKSIPFINCSHFILVVGFNEKNQTVCYNDPFYGIADKPQYGTYRWVNLTKFKTSNIRVGSWAKIFKDTLEIPLSKEEAFKRSHERNIEKLKGNFSVYFNEDSSVEEDENWLCGINALKRLRRDLEKGINHSIKTAYRYKLNNRMGIIYRLLNRLYTCYPQLFPFHPDMLILELNDAYEDIAIEKKYVAEYLMEIQDLLVDNNLSDICKHEAVLFEHEAENWTKLADYYSEFRKRGIFMLLPQAILLINKMAVAMDNIIAIEESIISGPSMD